MSVHFYGKTAGGEPIMLDLEDPASLGLEPGEEPSGEVSMPEARRAVMRARATFERRAESFTRSDSDTKRPGRVRVVECGVDHEYLARRIDDFERFLNVVVDNGATSIYWA